MKILFDITKKLRFNSELSLKDKLKELLSSNYVNEQLMLKKGITDLNFSFSHNQQSLSDFECYLYKYINRASSKLNICNLREITTSTIKNNYHDLIFKIDDETKAIFAFKDDKYLPIIFNRNERIDFSQYIHILNSVKSNEYTSDQYLIANDHMNVYEKTEYLCYCSLLVNPEYTDFAVDALAQFKFKIASQVSVHKSPAELVFDQKLNDIMSSSLTLTL